jgi:hypothetical protein
LIERVAIKEEEKRSRSARNRRNHPPRKYNSYPTQPPVEQFASKFASILRRTISLSHFYFHDSPQISDLDSEDPGSLSMVRDCCLTIIACHPSSLIDSKCSG